MSTATQNFSAVRVIATALIPLGLFACGSDATTGLPRAEKLEFPVLSSVYDSSTRTLGVTLSGTQRFTAETNRTVSASVVGGNGTYYYEWYQQDCYGGDCDQQSLYDAGWGMSSISLHLTTDMHWDKITVQIFDSPNLPYSASARATIVGPNQTGGGALNCQLGDDHFPIRDYNPATGTYSAYYRDGCTGERVYDPAHPAQ
jgi:hypothetical protein